MSNDMQRVVILLPEDVAQEFQSLCEERYETMSGVGRRLILEWIRKQKASSTSSSTEEPKT